ncbi:MAG: GTP-binding protein [Clostridiaceae bacterium]|nr:GTP-binding protein [Clostridiaceae bacterium]
MRKLVIGILAHVDAGKTTLSESLLYLSGKIWKLGRVDKKDAYLDNYQLERDRGITIFSKQAVFELDDAIITLLDTPGHADFSSEMERTLQVLDYAILVISGSDGIQGHTKTLWRLLDIYRIPVFLFINKMDQDRADRDELMEDIKKQLNDGCIDFGLEGTDAFYDQMAVCDEALLESYLEKGNIENSLIKKAIRKRRIFPCFFGSALKLEGVGDFLQGIEKYAITPSYPEKFGAKVFKIGRDEQGNRLTYMKITGGKLKVRDIVSNGIWEEKVNQIRIYSGAKFEAVSEAEAGTVCAVTGLSRTRPGEGLGEEKSSDKMVLEPVLTYQILLPEGVDQRAMIPKLRQLEEENPELNIVWNEQLKEIQVQVMGEVQTEILQSLVKERFGVDIEFDEGRIVYKETIADVVEGVGHFEPLKHYAEVHLLLKPGERGSGLKFSEDCSDDVLSRSWKNLILTHLKEKVHKGVLTGSPITDMEIVLVSGRAHNKHTEGGDFREATYRAVRQGLMEAESILLEPYYDFELEIPEKMVGRAMTDIEKMHGTCRISKSDGEMAILTGRAPVVTMRNYQKEVTAYTKGYGRLFCSLNGYEPCHNAEEVIEMIGYDPERDVDNPTGSVFCANGTSFLVSWDKVKEHMHVESYLKQRDEAQEEAAAHMPQRTEEKWLEPEEVDRILNQTYFANQGKKTIWHRRKSAAKSFYKPDTYVGKPKEIKEEYLLVDGYNIIFAWPELKELARDNMDSARERLLDTLIKYQGVKKCRIIVVFDAYRVQRHIEEVINYDTICVVYTREAQTADQYIEKFAHDNYKKYDITVATSDNLEQIIIRGLGHSVVSADQLRVEVENVNRRIMDAWQEKKVPERNYLGDKLSDDTRKQIDRIFKDGNDK